MSSSKSQRNRLALALVIQQTGFHMVTCARCARLGLKCVVSDKAPSKKCSECVRRGVANCDAREFSASAAERLVADLDRVKRERKEALARFFRLEQQQQLLEERSAEMIRRGFAKVEELEEADRKEAEASLASEQAAYVAPATSSTSSPKSLEQLPADFPDFSWDVLLPSGGTPPPTVGNSSSS